MTRSLRGLSRLQLALGKALRSGSKVRGFRLTGLGVLGFRGLGCTGFTGFNVSC